MRETRAAARVMAVPTASESLEEVARLAQQRLETFLRDKELGPEDILALSVTPVSGSSHEMHEAGAAGDRTLPEPGVLITLLYKARGRS